MTGESWLAVIAVSTAVIAVVPAILAAFVTIAIRG